MPSKFSITDYYTTSLKLGIACLFSREFRLEGIKRIANPLSFPRPEEFRLALHDLAPQVDAGRVLDVGSPKLPLVVLARTRPELDLYSCDILESFLKPTQQFLETQGLGERLDKTIHLSVEDARRLSFPDEYFDWIYSISVLEHIADEGEDGRSKGDTGAIRDIARVLRPGGSITLTVPFKAEGYREEFLDGTVYEREAPRGSKSFYQRYYDRAALMERLIEPSTLICEALVFFGEPGRIKVEPFWNRIPMKVKAPLLPFQGLIGNVLFRTLPDSEWQKASGVALRLKKPV